MATALFPGSFDPFTAGHEAVARRIAPLFDSLVIAVGVNTEKHYHFTIEQRMQRIADMMQGCPNVRVSHYEGMTIDFCHNIGATVIIRGIRNTADFEYEQMVAAVNRSQDSAIETLFVMADPEHQNISSTLERELLAHSGTTVINQHTS
ncbi:MAG: pantetheine-phosphate adenylyltransferase [Bacteroidales bacterium]|nr:pantetheine-phosphate adenylyltransferase [Bacteroidales bacterium]